MRVAIKNCAMWMVIFTGLLSSGCLQREDGLKMFKKSKILMDTYCSITVVAPSADVARDAIDAGFKEIERLDHLINYYSPESELSMINKNAGIMPVRVSPETLNLIEKSVYIAKITGGAFDPTVSPLLRLWRFEDRGKDHGVPSKDAIEKALRLVDYRKIQIEHEKSTVFLEDRGMEIDLGGIAKGYAADRAVEAIKEKGITAALVAVAGDIRGYGTRDWKIGLQNPRPVADNKKPWEDVIATLQLKDKAISTSGDYQRYFIKDNRRYHHILDPHTGYPADTGLISVSVIATEGYLSDSLATAVFVLGVERGLRLLRTLGLSGILITRDMKLHITKDIEENIDILVPTFTDKGRP